MLLDDFGFVFNYSHTSDSENETIEGQSFCSLVLFNVHKWVCE